MKAFPCCLNLLQDKECVFRLSSSESGSDDDYTFELNVLEALLCNRDSSIYLGLNDPLAALQLHTGTYT